MFTFNTVEFRHALEKSIQETYDFDKVILNQLDAHDGSMNTVFHMCSTASEGYVRVTTRADRSIADLMAEVDFIRHLDVYGVSVATPYTSKDGKDVSIIKHMENVFCYVIFRVATGEQLSHRGYKYIEGIPLSKHHYNCGQILAQIHKASETYIPTAGYKRHHILDHFKVLIETLIPYEMIVVRGKFNALINQLEQLEKVDMSYGMIHGDFGDGNYNIDYRNGNITLFDFDDAGYCWYMYEIASAWSASTGWVMHEGDLVRRKVLMDQIFATIVEGYRSIRVLDDAYIEQLPLYLKLVEMEHFLGELLYVTITEGAIDFEDEELQELIHCIENDIPYLGIYEGD
ncbi:phosphotransferase enzyme family protein [Vallitalea okinawensis]|uniref:phosphotransferase enzyme family protein n=1 Tax=Vallitalea okinawensis TaxID=2078660 RepID=UPI000CFBA548|nr:phosphotransferase [Vallitalea okinawensis]